MRQTQFTPVRELKINFTSLVSDMLADNWLFDVSIESSIVSPVTFDDTSMDDIVPTHVRVNIHYEYGWFSDIFPIDDNTDRNIEKAVEYFKSKELILF